MERRYVLFTDDEDAAFSEMMFRREQAGGYGGWDMAAVQDMTDPPATAYKFCVFQIEGNK